MKAHTGATTRLSRPRRYSHTAIAFFLGMLLTLASAGAFLTLPTFGPCFLLTLLTIGLLLAGNQAD